jgi:hypothetical protein
MALTVVSGSAATWLMTNRPGGLTGGTVYDCLVNDLQVNDYLTGARAFVVAVGTTGTARSVTLIRLGFTLTASSLVGASTVRIIR